MPYYHSGTVGPETAPLQSFAASPGLARQAAFDDAIAGNPTVVGYQYGRVQWANQGERLSREDAESAVKAAGVKLKIPESGYTQDALDILIERKRDEMRRQDILARAPGGFAQGAGQFGVGLLGSLLDPLSIASAFIPVVGPARYASMLERAGAGALARAAVRARVGALEGAVGAAVLEPGVYLGRTQLQDDYTMADSLLNVAFGTVMGGGLHVAGGRVADYFGGVGRAPQAEPEVRLLGDLTPTDARSLAFQEMTPQFRERLIAEAGNEAPRGSVSGLRAQADELRTRLATNAEDAEYRRIAKDFQRQGSTRKQAESSARKQVADTRQELQGRLAAVEQQIETNRAATVAQQDLAAIDRGELPSRFEDEVNTRAQQLLIQGEVQRMHSARRTAELATPRARRDALRGAVAQMAEGKVVDVDPVIRMRPPAEVVSAAQRTAAPEASAVADFPAAVAAEERLRAGESSATVEAAQAELDAASTRLADVQKNLEQGGYSADRLKAMSREMEAFDESVKDAQGLGNAAKAAAICGMRV